MYVRKEGVAKYGIIYNSRSNSATMKHMGGRRRIVSRHVDSYTPLKINHGQIMFFSPYFKVDKKMVEAAFGRAFLEGMQRTVDELEKDIITIKRAMRKIELKIE